MISNHSLSVLNLKTHASIERILNANYKMYFKKFERQLVANYYTYFSKVFSSMCGQ